MSQHRIGAWVSVKLRAVRERDALGAQDRGATQDSLNFTSLPKLVW